MTTGDEMEENKDTKKRAEKKIASRGDTRTQRHSMTRRQTVYTTTAEIASIHMSWKLQTISNIPLREKYKGSKIKAEERKNDHETKFWWDLI